MDRDMDRVARPERAVRPEPETGLREPLSHHGRRQRRRRPGIDGADRRRDCVLGQAPPAGTSARLLSRCVYTDIDDTGAVDGAAALVVLAGVAGPVDPADVTAVAANFETRENTATASRCALSALRPTPSRSLALSSCVGARAARSQRCRRLSRLRSPPGRLTSSSEIGGPIDNGKIRAVVIDADRAAIQSFTPTAPLAPVALSVQTDRGSGSVGPHLRLRQLMPGRTTSYPAHHVGDPLPAAPAGKGMLAALTASSTA